MSSNLRAFLSRLAAYQAAFSGYGLAGWIGRSFGETSFDQILWHLKYTEGAALRMGGLFLFEFCFEVLLFPLAFALLAAWLHAMAARRLAGRRRRALRLLPAGAGVAAVVALLAQFSVFSYARAQFEPDHFAAAYVDPRQARLQAGPKRNLVLVYMESLEQTYGDATVFGRDLLAATRDLGHSFPSYRGAAGAGWTIAGMVATQCGVPLKVYTEAKLRPAASGKTFLPGATCLGDLLQERGYRNVFMGGAPLSFAGKGAFLQDHGYAETWGREEWEQAGARPEHFNEWGLWDDQLFAHATRRLDELHAAGEPFNLTLLTIETHNPLGFMSPYCHSQGARDFTGIVACSNAMLARFLAHVRANGYLRDTAVVVLGDHLAMPNPVHQQLAQVQEERRIFNLFLAEPMPAANRGEILPFDLFPTLLALTGVEVEDGRLGLGYAALGALPDAPPQDREQQGSFAALRASAAYDRLWQQPSAARADAPDQLGGGVPLDEGD